MMVGTWEYDNLEGEATCERLGELVLHCWSSWTNDEGETAKAVFINRYDQEAEVYKISRFTAVAIPIQDSGG
ncbi:hypothetical protein NC796_25025 [Aliifodinibius sp. S!AR15-10]|uniref:hypothetical protein n=1 Tax=Aliifodinibius sp. S!AR15-10 TaxID=2950437 RepID=UPI002865F787|nr:hypothetical protein [Aliifodinibius sp. S!AR15-10]MDR8394433.1 hypothetical protein [Aliifodinibius sp. S!AR15-10]